MNEEHTDCDLLEYLHLIALISSMQLGNFYMVLYIYL